MVINILFLLSVLIIIVQFFQLYSSILYILLILEMIILICLWFVIKKNWISKKCSETKCNHLLIEMLRKLRHDMSNNIQIISCYATLKRNEDIIKQIDIINYIGIQQGLLTTFSSEELTAYLYKIHILYPNLIIDMEIEEEIKLVKGRFDEKVVFQVLDRIVDTIHSEVDITLEQHLILSIGSSDDFLIINLEFEGSISKVYDKIYNIEKKMIKNNGKFDIGLNNDHKFIVDMYFPLRKV